MKKVVMKRTNNVVKANVLISAKGRLTALEQKFFCVLVSAITPQDEADQKTLYSFPIRQFAGIASVSHSRIYEKVFEAAIRIMERIIVIQQEDGPLAVALLSSVKALAGEGRIAVRFSEEILPYIFDLKREFTKYQLKNVLGLRSAHAIRLYELLKQTESLKKRKMTISELKEYLGAGEKYQRFDHLKSRVLDPAIHEINEKTDINVSYAKIKEGREFVELKFTIKSNQKPQKPQKRLKKVDVEEELHPEGKAFLRSLLGSNYRS